MLLADLLELDDSLDSLLKAVRVAVGRHHQVMLIVPWPAGMRPPTEEPEPEQQRTGRLPIILGPRPHGDFIAITIASVGRSHVSECK